jgi:endoglucanase
LLLQKINLAGFDFGAQNDGTYTASNGNPAYPPPESQIDHFLSQNVNFFRIPVAWEYLQSEVNGALNEKNLATYKKYIDQITEKKAYVAIDLHAVSLHAIPKHYNINLDLNHHSLLSKYARFKGQIVGESPTMPATALANFWSQMGAVFKNNPYVMLGLVNEPHDLGKLP